MPTSEAGGRAACRFTRILACRRWFMIWQRARTAKRRRVMQAQLPLILAALQLASAAPEQANYKLKATPKTVAWGYYAANTPPALRIHSGDSVELETLITNSPARLEGAGVPP